MKVISQHEYLGDSETFLQSFGGIFFRPQMRNLGSTRTEVLLILDDNNQLFGALNVSTIRLKGVKTLAQPYLHPHCALFTLPLTGGMAAQIALRKEVTYALAEYLRSREERIVSLPFPTAWDDLQPLMWKGFKVSVKYTYRIDLKQFKSPEEQFSSKLRAHVRKAVDADVQIESKASFEELLKCWKSTSKDQNFEIYPTAIEGLLSLVESGDAELRAAVSDSNLVGFAFTVHDQNEAYYLLGALSREHKLRGAMPLLLSDAISSHANREQSIFDLEGSMIPGVEQFFRNFGGRLTPYYIATKAPFFLRTILQMKGKKEF